MKQIISRRGKVLCTTSVPYPKKIIEQMKDSGHEVVIKKETKKKDS